MEIMIEFTCGLINLIYSSLIFFLTLIEVGLLIEVIVL